MNWKRSISCGISEFFFLRIGIFGYRPGFRIMLYHAVGSDLAHDSYGISIKPESFELHMAALLKSKVRTVSLHEKIIDNSTLTVAVTFDDGYKDNLYAAAPILLKYKIPFTIFVTSSFIKSGSPYYMTQDELRKLASLSGVTIGSHGATHIPLAQCDDSTLWEELYGSKSYLEEVIGQPVTAIAYPYGSVNSKVLEAVKRAGYTLGVCSRFDINDENRNSLLLCRSEVVASDSERVFLQKINGAWDWYRWKKKDPATL